MGRSFRRIVRSPGFTYSHLSCGVQLADLACTVINRFHTDRMRMPRLRDYYNLLRSMVWRAKAPNAQGYVLEGLKIIGG